MKENLTNNAIIYAALAINSEISLQKEYLDSDEVPAEERENEEEILADLEQALMEFIDVYKIRRKKEPELPAMEDLLNGQFQL